MVRLSVAVILFVILVKSAFGADFAAVKEDANLNANIDRALSSAVAQSNAIINPYTCVNNYATVFREELKVTEALFQAKLGSAREFMHVLFPDTDEDMFMFEMTCFVRNLTWSCGDENKILMFKILSISKAVNAPVRRDLNWLHSVVNFKGDPYAFDEEAAFKTRSTQIVYINALAKLKKFNAELKTASVKRGESDYYKYGYKLLKIFE